MTEAAAPLEIRLAGQPRLRRGSRELSLDRKAAGGLAWLALRGPVLRPRLAELLWPTVDAESARNNLRQLIFKLKKAMDAVVIDGGEELRLPAAMRLDVDGDWLLEGCSYDDCPAFSAWLETARAAHRERRTAARLQAADAALAAGDLTQALALARALVADDELSEAAQQRLVQALYLRGERAAALEAAARCEALLRDALGVPLSEAMQRLVATLRSADGPAVPAAIPVSVLRPPRLIGRGRELALLEQARRDGRVALVAGESGLGKSRLLAEAAAARPGTCLFSSRPGDAGVPFAALARWLRALRDAWPEPLADLPPALHRVLPDLAPSTQGSGRLDLRRAVAEVLARAAAAGLSGAWFDDLHFADDASSEMLQSLLDEPPLQELSWVLARRPAEGGTGLQPLIDQLLDDGRLLPIDLLPLDAEQVTELVDSLVIPGLDSRGLGLELWRRTGGNPLFVLETIKAMLVTPDGAANAVRPRSVGALIERRLRQLSPGALALARVAALAGPDFGTDLAVHVLQTPVMALADAWAELESAQVLRESAFAHDLIFEATLDSVPAPIRLHARRAIAEFLAPRNGEPARIAEHWIAAGEPARAAPHFVAAGRRAEAAARYAEARQLFDQAATCHDQAGEPAQALDTRLALADLLMEAREFATSQAVVDGLFATAATVDDRLRVGMQQMHLYMRQGLALEAIAFGQRAVADTEWQEEATPLRLAMLRWTYVVALLMRSRAAEALAQLQLAEPSLAASDDASWRCWFHSQHGMALSQIGEVARAAHALKLAIAAARAVGRKRMIAGALQHSVTLAMTSGHLVEALDTADECLLLMTDTGGDDHFTFHVRAQRARILAALGRYREALEALEALGADDSPLERDTRSGVLTTLAELWTQLGQPSRAQAALRAAGDLAERPRSQLALHQARCEALWFADRPQDDALEAAEAIVAGLTPHPRNDILRWRAHPERIDVARLATLRARWDASGLAGQVVVADAFAADAAWRRGDSAAAAQLVARVLPASRRTLMAGVYRPWLLLLCARSAAAGDRELAAKALREGADWVHSVLRLQVPEPFRDGFLARNRVNRELLALAGKLAR